ncbi:MAG TPA: heparinase II/III family protein [bacterium]|nr:heparinase II/III family protein [bacterium]HPG44047.1 heparinase II/III family protein [bacterium]HPM96414.1 heparinase II/III family protein [bacterium]
MNFKRSYLPIILMVFLLCLSFAVSSANEKRFMFPEERLKIARANIKQHKWAQALTDSLRREADLAAAFDDKQWQGWIPEYTPTRVVDCPVCKASWSSYNWLWSPDSPEVLFCQTCSTRITAENYPDNHTISVPDPRGNSQLLPVHRANDGKIYQFRERIAYEKLMHIGKWLDALAAVYVLDGKEIHGRAIGRILTRLAQVYPGYALHDWERYRRHPWPLAGKISGWNYEDAVLIVACGKAYDATRNSSFWTPADRELVLQGVFRTAADLLTAIPPESQVINDTPFRYAGVAVCGRLLQDPEVMRWVLNRESGVVAFLLRYFFYDGSWCERSPSYHMMALREFHQAVDALYGYSDPSSYSGNDGRFDQFRLQDFSRLQRIYENLFTLTYPDGTLPPINDSHTDDRPQPLLADAAFAWFQSADALHYLAEVYGDLTLSKGDLFSLFNRPAQAPQQLNRFRQSGRLFERTSSNPGDLGLAVLRSQQQEPEVMVTADYGGVYGGHDHMDKLDFTLFAHGRQMVSDLGYVYANHPLRTRWMMRSLAHNTVTVNTQNQRLAEGECHLFYSDHLLHAIEMSSDEAYSPITQIYNRQLLLVERPEGDYTVDIFRIRGGDKHDWSAHAESVDLQIPDLSWREVGELKGRDEAYNQLKNVRLAQMQSGLRAVWNWAENPGASLHLYLLSPHRGSVYLATAPAQRKIDQEGRTLPYLIVRSEDRPASTFVAVWEPTGTLSNLLTVELDYIDESDDSWPVQIQVTWLDGTQDWLACALHDRPPVITHIARNDTPWHGRIGMVRSRMGRIEYEKWLQAGPE